MIVLILILQNLQIENETLRQEISALKKILAIPVNENHLYVHFRYQIYSLEKQIALLTRLLDVKREAVATCETILIELNEFLQYEYDQICSFFKNNVNFVFHRDLKGKIHRKENIDEGLIQTWIDRVESNRKKSYKSMQV